MREKVESILVETGFADNRAAKMDVDDLLKYVSHPFFETSLFRLVFILTHQHFQTIGLFQPRGNVRFASFLSQKCPADRAALDILPKFRSKSCACSWATGSNCCIHITFSPMYIIAALITRLVSVLSLAVKSVVTSF